MSFLLPGLLWLLPLAAIPIVLHLLTLHRLKTVELSTFRFLFDSYIQQRRRTQFLEALLAMLRTLFLLLVIVMVAGPVFSASSGVLGFGQGPINAVLLVDCSPSMNAGANGQSALAQARDAALVIMRSLREQDTVTLIQVAGSDPKVLYTGQIRERRADELSSDPKTAPTAEEAAALLTITASRGDVFAALKKEFGSKDPPPPNAHYFLITDCQASGWREVRDQGLNGMIPAQTPFAVINVGSSDAPKPADAAAPKPPAARAMTNFAVIGDAPDDAGAVVGLPCFLQARVLNASPTETANLTLSLFIVEKEAKKEGGMDVDQEVEKEAALTSLTLKPGETIVHRFSYIPQKPGPLRGSFRIASATPDAFPDDDRYLFALNVAPRIRVVIVDGQQPGPPPDAPKEDDVDEAHYLKIALTTADRGRVVPDQPQPGEADGLLRPFDVRVVAEAATTPAGPGQIPEALHDADVVVLANCGALQGPQFDGLRTFTSEGGGLMIFPGDRVNPQVYNTQFFPAPGPQGERVTPFNLDAPVGDPAQFDAYEPLGKIDFGHPALAALNDAEAETPPLSSFRIYKRFKLVPPEKQSDAWPLAWFSGGAPALVESRLGEGDVILSAFPAHTRWTNLPTRPDFTPFILQLVHHVARRPAVTAPTVVLADGQAEFTVDSSWGSVTAAVTRQSAPSAEKKEAAEAEKPVEVIFDRRGPRLYGRFNQTSEPGYYTLSVASTEPRQGSPEQRTFAVNLSPEESDFEMLGAEQVGKLLPMVHLDWFDYPKDKDKLEEHLKGHRSGLDDYWWIAMMLVIFANEMWLAMRGGRRGKADDGAGAERVRQTRAGSWVGGMAGARAK